MRKQIFVLIILFTFLQFTFSDTEEVKTKTSNLTIGGRLQTQFQYINSSPDNTRLLLRRARLSFSSKLNDLIAINLQMEAGKQSFTLKDAYLAFSPKYFSVFIGQKHVPFSREALNSSKYLQMIERARTSEFAPFRQMGIGIHGYAMDKKLEYMAGIYNGAVSSSAVSKLTDNMMGTVKIYHLDAGASAENNKFLFAGRIDFHPFGYMKKSQCYLEDLQHPLLSFGLNFISSDDSPKGGHSIAAAEIKTATAYGGDIAFKYKGFAGTFEYLHRSFSWWNTADQVIDSPQDTFSLQGGYMIIPQKFELAARYEWVKFDKNKVLLGPVGQNSDSWITLGLNYFLKGHHTKIQLNYILKKEHMPQGISEPENNTLLMQCAYYF